MRSMISALVCIAAVACGTLVTRLELPWLLGPLLGLGVALALFDVCRAPRDQAARWSGLGLGLLICVALLRGASAGPPEPPRPPERGLGEQLRVFELRGASEPGPRCKFELDGGGTSLRVSAPIEDCPLAQGDTVAIASASLRPHWSTTRAGAPLEIDLGRGPVVWRRVPAADRPWPQRALDGYWAWVAHRRQHAWQSSRGDPASSLVFAAGLGLRAALAPDEREHLRAAGLGHLIAVSGLHVAIAALWLQALARRLAAFTGVPVRWACVIAWLPLWGYVGLTGAAASAVRAATMSSVIDLGTVVGRPTHPGTVLATVAAGMLLWQPQWLLDPGFALSLAAMLAIVTAPPSLGVLGMSWRITWMTAPLSVLLFDTAPLHGLLGNAIALPLFGLMMPPALLASVGEGPLAEQALVLARWFAAPILDLSAWLSRLPGAGPSTLALLAMLGLLAHLGLRRASESAWPRLRACVPPRLACALSLAIALGLELASARTRAVASPSRFDWIVLGSVHSRALLVADHSAPGRACLYRPIGSSATWVWLLEQHGISEIARLDAALPTTAHSPQSPPRSDPRTRVLAEQLGEAGIAVIDAADDCRPPSVELLRATLHACKDLDARAPALARSWAGVEACAIEDRWVVVTRN